MEAERGNTFSFVTMQQQALVACPIANAGRHFDLLKQVGRGWGRG